VRRRGGQCLHAALESFDDVQEPCQSGKKGKGGCDLRALHPAALCAVLVVPPGQARVPPGKTCIVALPSDSRGRSAVPGLNACLALIRANRCVRRAALFWIHFAPNSESGLPRGGVLWRALHLGCRLSASAKWSPQGQCGPLSEGQTHAWISWQSSVLAEAPNVT
jgi:hypothetical protein